MKKELSLYIHIPFCNSKCNYCSFVSKVGTNEEKERYLVNLKKEINMRAKEYNAFYSIRTIYIGGGTPSCLPVGAIKDILQTIYKVFTVKNNAEISMELNPNTITKEKIREYVLSGVNRFSLGLQCTDGKILKDMGRSHSIIDFDQAIAIIREHGISNINADFMIGYPGQKLSHILDTIKHLVKLNIPHISSYMLSVEQGTPLQLMIDKGVKYLPKENQLVKMYQTVTNELANHGYTRYEISNFAKPGFMCKHNLIYWLREDYLGLGVAAHSYLGGVRFSNTENIEKYNDCIEKLNKVPVALAKPLTQEEKKEEFVMLSLRTAQGLDVKQYQEEFGSNFLAEHKDLLTSLIKNGFLVLDKDGNIKATNKGYLVLNKIVLELCSD